MVHGKTMSSLKLGNLGARHPPQSPQLEDDSSADEDEDVAPQEDGIVRSPRLVAQEAKRRKAAKEARKAQKAAEASAAAAEKAAVERLAR